MRACLPISRYYEALQISGQGGETFVIDLGLTSARGCHPAASDAADCSFRHDNLRDCATSVD
jgi:hypothetical protein